MSVGSLSAGKDLWDMLAADTELGNLDRTPIFLDPHKGREFTYDAAAVAFKDALRCEINPELATGFHYIRVGGATTYANATAGSEIIAGFMRVWVSEARRLYLWSCEGRLEMAAGEIGSADGVKSLSRRGNWAEVGAERR